MAPELRLWKADNLRGARGLGDIRGSSSESDWYRATMLKEETPVYDVNRFKTIESPQQVGDLRHNRSSGWNVKGGVEVSGMMTLEASRQGATLDIFQRITTEELDIRPQNFHAALNQVIKTESRKSNMLLPKTGFLSYFKGDSERMKMRVLATQAFYAEKRHSYVAESKGATISISGAAVAAGTAVPSGGISALALVPTANLTVEKIDVRISGEEGVKSLVAYALQPFVCRRSGDCWELDHVEHKFVKPSSSQVSPLEWMWSS